MLLKKSLTAPSAVNSMRFFRGLVDTPLRYVGRHQLPWPLGEVGRALRTSCKPFTRGASEEHTARPSLLWSLSPSSESKDLGPGSYFVTHRETSASSRSSQGLSFSIHKMELLDWEVLSSSRSDIALNAEIQNK